MSQTRLSDFINAVQSDDFDERPVKIEEFLYSENFLNFPPLSDIQIKAVEAMTQIYHYDTLVDLWGQEEADRLSKSTQQEIILMLGKGSGKDLVTSIAFARIAYLLLCLKDPAKYYGKPPGDTISMLNVAINAQQAKNVFFRYFKQRIKLCKWFNGKWDETADALKFDKNIVAYSGHSEREAWEGYNFIIVVLDEISGFATDSEATAEGSRNKTADSIYKMYKASVSSRFPRNGKLVLLSFPRYKGDFIDTRYNEVTAEKVTSLKSHTFKIHEDLADGIEDNELFIEWEEDDIVSYRESGVFALKRPTWEVNPTISIDDLKPDFIRDQYDALSRFACMPSEAVDAFFRDRNKIEIAFPPGVPGPFLDDWSWRTTFSPSKERSYYLHVDLAYKHDRAAVAMASAGDWVTIKYSENLKNVAPLINVDAVRFWTPSADQNIDIEDVKKFIVELKMAGFPIKLVTFDRWNSLSYRQELQKDFGIKTDLLSVAKPHYEDFSIAVSEERVRGYGIPILVDELLGLRVIKGNKVDHQRKGSKDVSDAVVGAIYNVIAHEKSATESPEIEVYISKSPDDEPKKVLTQSQYPHKKRKMPKSLAEFISSRSEEDEEVEETETRIEEQEVDLSMYLDGKRVV